MFNMLASKAFLLLLVVALGHSVVIPNERNNNDLDDSYNLKSVILDVKERLDKWDAFFMGRLEPRMLGAATSLANLDSNIRNLQERAHVWDTFQLHVSAWNDQIKALDHKVNSLNENMISQGDSALNANGTLQQIASKLANLDARISTLGNGMQHGVTPLFGDFAARGLLHTVRQLENKMDRMLKAQERISLTQDTEDSGERASLNAAKTECSTPQALEDILHDIAAKVDTMFDRQAGEGSEVEVRHSGNACKRLIGPTRKLLEGVELVKSVLLDLVEESPEGEKASLRQRRRLPVLSQIKNSLEDIEGTITRLGRQQDRNVNENERILRRIDRKLDQLDREEDDNEKEVLKRLRSIDRRLRDIKEEVDDDDDDDKKKDDTDEDDSDDDDDDKRNKKRKNKNDADEDDDTDEDDDSDDDDDRRNKKRKNRKDTDEDDDDSDDDDRRNKKRKNKDDTDEDDDDDSDDDDDRRNKRRKNKKDTDEDDDDSDDDDNRRNKRKKSKNNTDEYDDDSDDDDRRKSKKNDDTDEDDSDDDRRKSKRKNKNDTDEDDDDDSKEKKGKKNDDDDDTDEDDDDDDNNGNGNGRNHYKRQTPVPVNTQTQTESMPVPPPNNVPLPESIVMDK